MKQFVRSLELKINSLVVQNFDEIENFTYEDSEPMLHV